MTFGDIYSANNEPYKAFRYYILGLQQYENAGDNALQISLNKKIGDHLMDMEAYKKANTYYTKAKSLETSSHRDKAIDQAIAKSHLQAGELDRAQAMYELLETHYDGSGDKGKLIETKKSLAKILDVKDEYSSSLIKKEEVLNLALEMPDNQLETAIAYNNLGYAYQKTSTIGSAQESFEKANDHYSTLDEEKYYLERIIVLINLSIVIQNQNDVEGALSKLETALNLSEKYDDPIRQAEIGNMLTKMHLNESNLAEALEYNEKAVAIATDRKLLGEQLEAYDYQVKIYQKLGEPQKNLEAFQRYSALKAYIEDQERGKDDHATKRDSDLEK